MITVNTRGYFEKKRNVHEYKPLLCIKQFTQEELQTLTPTEREIKILTLTLLFCVIHYGDYMRTIPQSRKT